MQLARVIGSVVATVKDRGLHARKLLLIQPVDRSTGVDAPLSDSLVAVDGVGVGVGELIFYVRGKEASFVLPEAGVPADVGIVGKVDSLEQTVSLAARGRRDRGLERP
jgi:ethanolamine utilization protein EutN